MTWGMEINWETAGRETCKEYCLLIYGRRIFGLYWNGIYAI